MISSIPLRMLQKWSFISLLILFTSVAIGQVKDYYPYYSSDTLAIHNLAMDRKNSVLKKFAINDKVSSAYKKDFYEIRDEASESAYYNIRYNALLDPIIEPYVQSVFRKVVAEYPEAKDCKLIVVNSPVPNAYSMGDGTIYINTALLAKLENESQLAFIIGHELSHVVLGHSEKSIRSYLDRIHDKELKKEIKKIIKDEYEMASKLKSLVLKMSLDFMYHSRNHEQETDSLAYLVLRKLPYQAKEASRSLALLDSLSNPYANHIIDFNTHFNCDHNQYSFNTSPVVIKSIFNIDKDEDEFSKGDTLKTHPDCLKRAKFIEDLMILQPPMMTPAELNHEKFLLVKKLSRLESTQAWFDYEYYDHALYNAILLSEEEPENQYLKSIIILSLYQLKKYMKKHEYSDVVSKLSVKNPDNFNQLIDMLHNLRLSNFNSFADCYHKKTALTIENEYAIAVQYALAELKEDKSISGEILKKYDADYPNGRLDFIFERPLEKGKKKKK